MEFGRAAADAARARDREDEPVGTGKARPRRIDHAGPAVGDDAAAARALNDLEGFVAALSASQQADAARLARNRHRNPARLAHNEGTGGDAAQG
ncbi:dsRBD fold-containing protein [Phreatobacter sp. HK31-P]